jgi:hypothetical protein
VIQEYGLVKEKRNQNFKKFEEICKAFKVHPSVSTIYPLLKEISFKQEKNPEN